jgi:hypothetical protein
VPRGSLVAHLRPIGGAGGVEAASGAMQARLGHHVRVKARGGAREQLRVAGWLWARAVQQDNRRRQWQAAAGGKVARAREGKRKGVYRPGGA